MQNLILCVFGRKGEGKTTLVQEIMEEHDRVNIIDTVGQYGASCGCTVFDGREAAAFGIAKTSQLAHFRNSCRDADTANLLPLLDVCYEVPKSLVIVEEASFYCSPVLLPREVSQLVRYGRHRELDQIYVSQRPASINRDLTAQADIIVSFNQREARDVAYLIANGGTEAEGVRELPPHECLAWGPGMDRCPLAILARISGRRKRRLTTREEIE